MKKLKLLLPIVLLSISSCKESSNAKYFSNWNSNSITVSTLKSYMADITDYKSKNYIPYEDRIAVFDMDGTIYSETNPTNIQYLLFIERVLNDSTYSPSELEVKIANGLFGYVYEGKPFDSELKSLIKEHNALPFAGMTIKEYNFFLKKILNKDVPGFTNLRYENAFYTPMLEVIDYLNDNDFDTYIVSASDRIMCRALLDGKINVPSDHILGSDVILNGKNQPEGTDNQDYDLGKDEELVRTAELLYNSSRTNKATLIAREVGKKPVLAFGNSSHDTSMLNYCLSNTYKNMSFMLVHDDNDRETADVESELKSKTKWESLNYHTISMKDEFKIVFDINISKK